jgi:hypothetical protein
MVSFDATIDATIGATIGCQFLKLLEWESSDAIYVFG